MTLAGAQHTAALQVLAVQRLETRRKGLRPSLDGCPVTKVALWDVLHSFYHQALDKAKLTIVHLASEKALLHRFQYLAHRFEESRRLATVFLAILRQRHADGEIGSWHTAQFWLMSCHELDCFRQPLAHANSAAQNPRPIRAQI